MMRKRKAYTIIILMFAISVMVLGLMVAVPVWQTQIQREKELELIFRGKQYVEAIRLYQIKNPGSFPKTLDELIEENFLRKLYKDPITKKGEWNIILHEEGVSTKKKGAPQKILVAPQNALTSIDNPQIIGVVSSSTNKSIKIYLDQESYDKWLFFYGQDPKNMPEIIYYGQEEKD
ncbi:MAG: type II secretion system protein [Candidatus Aminicenantes bacterium]|nr:type II secretion system protein [Candidatus Aminicenantes bacterium]